MNYELSTKPSTDDVFEIRSVTDLRAAPQSPDDPRVPLSEIDTLFETYESDSGETVTPDRAMSLPAFFQAVNLLAGDIAKIPIEVFEYQGKDRNNLRDDPISILLRNMPNEDQTPFEFFEQLAVHLLLYRNAYLWVIRDSSGTPTELIPLLPDRTRPYTVPRSGRKVFLSEVGRKLEYFDASEICHIKGLSFDGQVGADFFAMARQALGHALSVGGFKSRFFKGGAKGGGILELPRNLKPMAQDKIEKGFRKTYENKEAWFKTIVLRDGAKFHDTQKNLRESQLIEISKEDVRNIARLFNCPPHKLGDDSKVSRNTLEEENKSYYDNCLSHWLIRIAQRLQRDLIAPKDRGKRFIEHTIAAIHWADLKTVTEIINNGVQNSWLVPNEGRRWLNLPPIDGGDQRLVPLNMSAQGETPADDTPIDPVSDERHKELIQANYREALKRAQKRLQVHAEKAKRTGGQAFVRSLDDHRSKCLEILGTSAQLMESLDLPATDLDQPIAEIRQVIGESQTVPARVFEIIEGICQ